VAVLAGVALFVAAVEVAADLTGGPPPHAILLLIQPALFFSFAMMGVFIVHLMNEPGDRDIVCRLGVALELARLALLYAIGVAHRWADFTPGIMLLSLGPGFGLAALAVTLTRALRADRFSAERIRRRDDMMAVLPFLLAIVAIPFFLWTTQRILPLTLDGRLYEFDEALGVGRFARLAAALCNRDPWLLNGCRIVYLALPLAVVVMNRKPALEHRARLATLCMIAAVFGFMLYFVVPATGPLGAFGDALVPPAPLSGAPAPTVLPYDRNAMPSLHAAWAYLVLIYARGAALAVRAAVSIFLALTLVATLGLGQHYVIDLVVAVPFALVFRAVCAGSLRLRSPARRRSLLRRARHRGVDRIFPHERGWSGRIGCRVDDGGGHCRPRHRARTGSGARRSAPARRLLSGGAAIRADRMPSFAIADAIGGAGAVRYAHDHPFDQRVHASVEIAAAVIEVFARIARRRHGSLHMPLHEQPELPIRRAAGVS